MDFSLLDNSMTHSGISSPICSALGHVPGKVPFTLHFSNVMSSLLHCPTLLSFQPVVILLSPTPRARVAVKRKEAEDKREKEKKKGNFCPTIPHWPSNREPSLPRSLV